MAEIKKLDLVSFGVAMGVITAILSFIYALLLVIGLGSLAGMLTSYGIQGFSVAFGLASLIVMPIVGFIGGFVGGVIDALIYNLLVVKWVRIRAE